MRKVLALALPTAFLLAACGAEVQQQYPGTGGYSRPDLDRDNPNRETIFGPGGLTDLFGGGKKTPGEGGGEGIGVNSYLWRASLDTVSFMPVASADPFGGVIITDWHSPADTPDERFKMNVYILSRELRADGVRVAVFRQRRNGAGEWVDTPVAPTTATDLENAILTRARQLRVASSGR